MEVIRISNISNYHLEIINNELILTPIRKYITENELLNKDLTHSIITYCIIKDIDDNIILNNSNNISYVKHLIDIYKNIPSSIILQNTTFNISLREEDSGARNFMWYPEIKMCIQRKEARGTLREILNMVKINNFKIDIGIKLNTGETVNYKN